MAAADDIVVEVIVWDGSFFKTKNPCGHVTTKITKNGIPYSYSLEDDPNPKVVCNTESFNLLEKHEQSLRDGFGFNLNVTQEQAREIFLMMQTTFHGYKTKNCNYDTLNNNCTYAIQVALKKSGVQLHPIISNHFKSLQVNSNQTILPSYFEEGILKTKNNNAWLVKEIIQYKKGLNNGDFVKTDEIELLFDLKAIRSSDGWYSTDSAYKSTLLW